MNNALCLEKVHTNWAINNYSYIYVVTRLLCIVWVTLGSVLCIIHSWPGSTPKKGEMRSVQVVQAVKTVQYSTDQCIAWVNEVCITMIRVINKVHEVLYGKHNTVLCFAICPITYKLPNIYNTTTDINVCMFTQL